MIHIAVCDDDAKERAEITERICRYQKENQIQIEVTEYQTGESLLGEYAWQFDILIMDVELENEYGIDVAKAVRQKDEDVLILFSTNYTDYAYDSFSADPVGYLQKSESYQVFAGVLQKIISKIHTRQERMVFSYEGVTTAVSMGQIEYLEYHDREVIAKRIDGSYEKTKDTLRGVLEHDQRGLFVQISRDVAVGILWIDACGDGTVTMRRSKKKFKISTRRKKHVEEMYLKYLRDRMVEIGEEGRE